jgi:hypothetical protein
MKFKLQFFLLLLVANALFASCKCFQNSDSKLFAIKEAYYQSWVIDENEKGTNIFIEIKDVANGVVFDSIVFRGLRLPVTSEIKDSLVVLKSAITSPLSKIFIKNEYVDQPNQLIYRYNGVKHHMVIKELNRKSIKYY